MDKKYYYIRGNSKHPERVREALIKAGAVEANCSCDGDNITYTIDADGCARMVAKPSILYNMLLDYGTELFIEPDYKYNIGDLVKVNNGTHKFVSTVTMQFNGEGKPYYCVADKGSICYPESQLFPFPEPQVLTWDDMMLFDTKVKGYFITDKASIGEIISEAPAVANLMKVFRIQAQAKSALAMAQISQLIEQPAYGGWCPPKEHSYIIRLNDDGITIMSDYYNGGILRFDTREQAERFLKYNEQLVKDYLMMD